MPHAVGPEKSVLSCIFQDPAEYLPRAHELGMTPESFYLPAHQGIFRIVEQLAAEGETVEFIALTTRLHETGELARHGGASGLADIATYNPAGMGFDHHARIILERAALRDLIHATNEIQEAAYGMADDVPALIDDAEKTILAIRDRQFCDKPATVEDDIRAILHDYELRWAGTPRDPGLPTGIKGIDEITLGLRPGELTIIGARPSVGKTALMLNIVEHVCIDHSRPVAVFSLEMPRRQIVERLVISRSGHNSRNDLGPPAKAKLIRVNRAFSDIRKAPLTIDDRSSLTITELQARARRYKKNHGIQAIFVDYLQLLRSKSRQADQNREREVAEISAGLKAIAKELSIPVVCLAQLNREVEKRTGKHAGPRMSDLKDSGSIEADADIIGLLHRADYQAQNSEGNTGGAELAIAKNRNGPTGPVPMTYIANLMRFENGAPAEEPETPAQPKSRYDNEF